MIIIITWFNNIHLASLTSARPSTSPREWAFQKHFLASWSRSSLSYASPRATTIRESFGLQQRLSHISHPFISSHSVLTDESRRKRQSLCSGVCWWLKKGWVPVDVRSTGWQQEGQLATKSLHQLPPHKITPSSPLPLLPSLFLFFLSEKDMVGCNQLTCFFQATEESFQHSQKDILSYFKAQMCQTVRHDFLQNIRGAYMARCPSWRHQ